MVVWKPVPGYETFYEVSSDGQIRSLRVARALKPGVDPRGNLKVLLYGGMFRRATVKIANIVAWAFLGPKPVDKPFVLHRDDNKNNNSLSNLYYGNNSDNQKDAYRNGRVSPLSVASVHKKALATKRRRNSFNSPKGEQHYKARLNLSDVQEIRRQYHADGARLCELARCYQCTEQNIFRIVNNITWIS